MYNLDLTTQKLVNKKQDEISTRSSKSETDIGISQDRPIDATLWRRRRLAKSRGHQSPSVMLVDAAQPGAAPRMAIDGAKFSIVTPSLTNASTTRESRLPECLSHES